MKKKIADWFDGDSGIFSDGTEFRLSNVRAQEKYQFGGRKAARTVVGMTNRSNGWVSWKPVALDIYGRQVGVMSNHDGSINRRMKAKGYSNKGR